MYTLNSNPRNHSSRNLSASASSSPVSAGPPSPTKSDHAAQQLTSHLMAEVSQMSHHQQSLPPSFVTAFVRKCFASELNFVDFPQALTALDYLKDLESRRRKDVKSALERLDIRPGHLDSAEDDLRERYPGVLEWYHSLEEKENKLNALYTQLYLSLRRWILLNELMLVPFSKHNCLAMLNTLFPPLQNTQPTPQLTPAILKNQRESFFKYIQAVEKSGHNVLKALLQQGRRHGEESGWPAVRETLDKYLIAANSNIDECSEILYIDDPACLRRKVDSGISFGSRKSSTASTTSNKQVESVPAPKLARPQYKSTTTLEKIARELRHITRSRTDVEEMIAPLQPAPVSPTESAGPRGLRKMKSLSSLSLRRSASRESGLNSRLGSDIPAFDAAEMKRNRAMYDNKLASIATQSIGMAM